MDDDDEAGPGVPEWVVTYGDMMSLLLTFFIMLVSMSEIVSDQRYRAVLESLHQRMGYRFAPVSPPGENFPLNELIDRVQLLKLGSFTNDDTGYRGTMTVASPGDDKKVFTRSEGSGRRVGPPISPDLDRGLSALQARELLAIVRDLRGEPNKIEIRSWLPTDTPDEPGRRRQLRLDAYRRAAIVQRAIADAGIDDGRLRTVVATAPAESTMLSQALQRDGAVTLSVLDVFETNFVAE